METGLNILFSQIGNIIMIELSILIDFSSIFRRGKESLIGYRRYILFFHKIFQP